MNIKVKFSLHSLKFILRRSFSTLETILISLVLPSSTEEFSLISHTQVLRPIRSKTHWSIITTHLLYSSHLMNLCRFLCWKSHNFGSVRFGISLIQSNLVADLLLISNMRVILDLTKVTLEDVWENFWHF